MIQTQNKYNFTDEQLAAYDKLLDFSRDPMGGMFLVEGYAGTGKTYLAGRVIQELVDCGYPCVLAAPTHKAVRVLYRETNIDDKKLKFATIHGILGLQEHIDGYGKVKFVPDPKRKGKKLSDYKFLFVDETSMLDDDLFNIIEPFVRNYKLHVVFFGDPAQIPPVNKLDCIPFREDQRKKFKIERVQLTQIVRQEQDNPIIQKTFEIRENINKASSFNSLESKMNLDGLGVTFLHNKINQDDLIMLIKTLFTSDKFKNDPDHAKVIAWRNEVVDMYNDIIRLFLYGENIGKLVVGEKLIMDAPIIKEEALVLNTNDEVVVDDYDIKEEYINKGKVRIKYYQTHVTYTDIKGKSLFTQLKIIHEDSEDAFDNHIQSIKDNALKEKQGSLKAKLKWVEYYRARERFAKVKYNYSITAHKSQGSTYTNVIVLDHDLNANSKLTERNRIKYTACSRPRQNLYIVL